MSYISDHQKARRNRLVSHHRRGKGSPEACGPRVTMFLIRQVLLVLSWHLPLPGACLKPAVGKLTASPFSNASGDTLQGILSPQKGPHCSWCAGVLSKVILRGIKIPRVRLKRDVAKLHPFSTAWEPVYNAPGWHLLPSALHLKN